MIARTSLGWISFALLPILFTAGSAAPIISVRTGIELTTVGTPIEIAGRWPAVISPDQSKGIVEVYRGDIASNTNRYSLLLFQRGKDGSWQGGERLFARSSRDVSNVPGLARPKWSADSRSLFALVTDRYGISQIHRLGRGGAIASLSASRTGIVDYAFSSGEETLAYLERLPREALVAQHATYSGLVVGRESIYALLEGRQEQLDARGYGGGLRVMVRSAGKLRQIRLASNEWPIAGSGLSVSPDGRFVVIPVVMARRDMPQAWERLMLDPSWVWISGLRIFDLRDGSLAWMIDSPALGGAEQSVSWSSDNRYALVNDAVSVGADGAAKSQALVADVLGGHAVASFPGSFLVEYGNTDLTRVRLIGGDGNGKAFQLVMRSGTWSLIADRTVDHAIEILQDFAHKPVIGDFERESGNRTEIYDLNSDLDTSALNPVREYRWNSGGKALLCGLYLPRGITAGRRYPLVIQTHGWSSKQFSYDGISSAGFAAQALASAGFIVAQVGGVPGVSSTTREEPANAMMFDDLIDALVRDGLVDASRVGITGWSRTGLSVRYALAFGRHKYAAAVLADSASGGYFDYLLSPPQVQVDYDNVLGGAPFGPGIASWAERSAMLNFNRIDTPMRVLGFGPKILHQYENLASAQRLGKRLELVWLPAANHWPIHPSERMEAQQGSVDWYRYWLMGQRGLSPAARKEAERWDAMNAAGVVRSASSGAAAGRSGK